MKENFKYTTLIFCLIILTVFIFESCKLRDAEDPVSSRSTFIPPTSPDLVLVNLQYSVIEKDINNYMSCITDSNYSSRRFSYTADVTSQIQYPIFRTWGLNNEKSYYNNLISLTDPNSNSNLFFTNQTLNIFSDTAVCDAEYLLRVDHQKPNVAKTLKGKVRFVLSSDSRNLWSIHNWTDIKANATDTTWSILKANFSN